MSHFSVMVRVPASTTKAGIEAAVTAVLAPYAEQDPDYYVFEDTEDGSQEKYETESVEYIRMPDGELLLPWDEKFRIGGSIGLGSASHKVPDGLEHVEVPHKDKFATFEEYMKEWEGLEGRDSSHGRYGYHRNPNAKWDYWRIGGRWRGSQYLKSMAAGFVPLEGGLGGLGYEYKHYEGPVPGSSTEVDFCRIKDLDFDRIATEIRTRVDAFWDGLNQFLTSEKSQGYDGPRSAMLDVGMLRCIDTVKLTGTEFYAEPWGRQPSTCDVIDVKPELRAWRAKLEAALNPLRTYAYVDAGGWRAKGEMGWFGSSSATPESAEVHGDAFTKWLRSGDEEDWVVMVDCHT